MNSVSALKNHIKLFKYFGVWPSSKTGLAYDSWTIFVFIFVGVGFSLSQLVNCLFVQSVDDIINSLIVASSTTVVTLKGVNLYLKKKELLESFESLQRMDERVRSPHHRSTVLKILNDCRLMYTVFSILYVGAAVTLAIQVIFTTRDTRFWASTFYYPYKWSENPFVYFGGLFYQGITNTLICVFAIVVDTYGIFMSYILIGHLQVLSDKFEHMKQFEIKDCCQYYEEIIK